MEYFDVLDRFGEKTGQRVERETAHKTGVCHRVVHLWLVNSHNQVLLQQRSANKDAGAGLWYVSAAGHIEAGETAQSTLLREAQEELGVDLAPMAGDIDFLYTFREKKVENGGAFVDDEFYDVFVLRAELAPESLRLQAEEVQAVRYVDYPEFRAMALRDDPSLWHHDVAYKLLVAALDHYLGWPAR